MPKYSEITFEQVAALMSQFDVGIPESFDYVNGGLANTNLKVFIKADPPRAFLLKVCEEKSFEELHFQLEALHQLKAYSFPGAFPYPKKGQPNEYVATLPDGKTKALLFDFLPGRAGDKESMNDQKAIELGRAQAKLHLVPPPTSFLEKRPRFPPGLCDIDPFLQNELPNQPESIQSHRFVKRYLQDILPRARPFLELQKLPKGIVHGDIFPDNCMFDGDRLVAVLDFEEAALEPQVLDVAVTIVGCFFDMSNKLNARWAYLFLETYIEERKKAGLPVLELEYRVLPHFVNYALIAIAFWRWRQFNIRRPELSHLKNHHEEITNRIDHGDFDSFYATYYADKMWHYLHPEGIKYTSTRAGVRGLSFERVLLSGYAADGGLVMPENIPKLPRETILRWRHCSYPEVVKSIMAMFVSELEVPFDTLSSIIDDAFSTFATKDVLPLVKVGEQYFLEMFHGQTGAFKDLAMTIIGRLIQYFLKKSNKYLTIVVGTSGDTGSAAIYSVRGCERIDIIVLYPYNRISEIQQLQMVSSSDKNVHVFGCDGTSDDLDEPIKAVLNDNDFVAQNSLCSINSINWARVMIQVAHFFYSYLHTLPQSHGPESNFQLVASVPTGACGNLVGAFLAHEMGLPIKIIAGVNENDIIHRVMQTGKFSKAAVVEKTIAPSMDIQVPYNWERALFMVSGGDSAGVATFMEQFYKTGVAEVPESWMAKLRTLLSTASVHQDQMRQAIKELHEKHNYIMEPHTAIGCVAYRELESQFRAVPHAAVCLSTATPAKFTETMESILGFKPELPESYKALFSCSKHFKMLERGDNWEAKLRQTISSITASRH